MNLKSRQILDLFNKECIEQGHLSGAVIELLTKCNLSCRHCYLPSHDDIGLSKDRLLSLLRELRKLGVVEITFTGGEIFLRDDIYELIEAARKEYMRVFLLTNATMISDLAAKKVAELNVAQVSTTVFSMNPEVHDYITKSKGSLKRTLKGVERLIKCGVPVVIKTPVMTINYKSVMDIKKYCDEIGCEFIYSTTIFEKINGDKSPKELELKEDELKSVIRQMDGLNSDNEYGSINRSANKKYGIPCVALRTSLAIDRMGNVYPCNSYLRKMGNIREKTISEIWNSAEMRHLRSITNDKLIECRDCEYSEQCTRCPGIALQETGDEFGCDPMARRMAEIRTSL